ncbi:MAG: fibronectin type III domain-containing protein [Patescibacteria group bacterium]
MKNTRAKLIDFAANNKCKKESAKHLTWPICSVASFFLGIATFVVNFFIVLLTIPFSMVYTPTKGFQKLGRHNGKGYFFDSYTRYLRFHRASIGTVVAVIVVVAAKVILTFVALHPDVIGAKGGGEPPVNPGCEVVTIYTNEPSSAQTIEQGDTFTLSGHFCNADIDDLCAVCGYDQPVWGRFRLSGGGWGTITTSSALKTSGSNYSADYGSSGDTMGMGCYCQNYDAEWSRTVTANTGSEGKVYEVRFRLQNGSVIPEEYHYSSAKTINILPLAPTNFTHSANTTSSITWSWADASANETGYYVQNAGDTNLSADLGANASSWQETSLSPNTQYTRHSNVYAASGDNDSNQLSAYTAIETPTGVAIGTTTSTAVTLSASGTLSYLASGSSGLYFSETVTNTNSNWTQTNSWQKTGLSPNTAYTFKVKARNGDSDVTAETATSSVRTLSPAPDVSSDRNTQTWYKTGNFTFTNDLGFGEGAVGYYRYSWKKSATHSWTGSETQWNSGSLGLAATSAGSWYLHLKSYNDDDVANSTETYGPYYFDNVVPTITSYEPTLDATTTTSQPPVINVDFSKTGGNSTSTLSNFAIRGRTTKGIVQAIWTTVAQNINAKTYSNNWTVPRTFFNSLKEGVNVIDIKVTDKAGNVTTEEAVFYIIKDTLGPEISLIAVAAITNAATITWTTDEAATSQLEWGSSNALGYLTTATDEYVTSHSVILTGLDENTSYFFKCHSTDQQGQESTSSIYPFTTAELPALLISDVLVVDATDTTVVVTWTTDRAAASKVRYGTTTDFGETVQDTEYVTDHSISLTDLEPNTQYYYEVISWDADGIYAYDSYATFSTGETVVTPEEFEETAPELEEITVNDSELPCDSVSKNESRPLIRQRDVTLEGKTTPFATVVVELFSDPVITTVTADANGYWSATFVNVSLGEHKVFITVSKNSITIEKKVGSFIVYNPAATIVYPVDEIEIVEQRPLIKGLAKSGYRVNIYLDGNLNGYTTATTHSSGTGSFAYQPPEDLGIGCHQLYTISVDNNGIASDTSDTISFCIFPPFISPAVFDPNIDAAAPPNITLTGLAHNGSTILVYLDDSLYGSFEVTDHPSGTAYFSYTLSTNSDLASGNHSIYLVATDAVGRSSLPSRTISFNKPSTTSVTATDSLVYTVQARDSLWNIAQSYYGDGKLYQRLIDNNKEQYPALLNNPGVIQAGWRLLL